MSLHHSSLKLFLAVLLAVGLGLTACEDPESEPRERIVYGDASAANVDVDDELEDPSDSEDEPANEDPNNSAGISDEEANLLLANNCLEAGCHAETDNMLDNPNAAVRLNDGSMPPEGTRELGDQDRQNLANYIQARTSQ